MSETLSKNTFEQIDALIYEWLADTAAPGASVTIVNETDTLYQSGYGARHLATNNPATPDTLYGFASVTKSFTALAILQCVDRGELSLDDPIAAHTEATFDGADEVTIHELLSHSSGIPSLSTSSVLLARQAGMADVGVPLGDRDDLYYHINGVGDERDEHSFGRFMYNNTGYILLSHAVESATGQPFEQYVTDEILTPLSMDRSTFDADAYDSLEDHATPYLLEDDGDGFTETSFPARKLSYGPGGLITSASDLGNYLQFNLGGGVFDGDRLVSEGLLGQAHSAHIEPLPRYGDGYGYGWSIHDIAGTTVIGHGGSLLTSSSAIGFLPEHGLGFALGCAAQPEIHPTEIGQGIVALLLDEAPQDVVPAIGYRSRVTELVGKYEAYRGVTTATVTEEGGMLSLELSIGPIDNTYTLIPDDPALHRLTFTTPKPGQPAPVEFVRHDEGVDLFVDRNRLHKQ